MAKLLPYLDKRCPHSVDLILSEARGQAALEFARHPETPGLFAYWKRMASQRYTLVTRGKIGVERTLHYEFRFSDPDVALEMKLKFG